MNTAPLFSDVAPPSALDLARASEDRAAKRLAWVRRLIRETRAKLADHELALTRATLRGRPLSESPVVRVLRGQLDCLLDDERTAQATLYAAADHRQRMERAA